MTTGGLNTLFFYREFLQREFSRRQQTNASYSMRSFARSLDLDPGTLSHVLAGKRSISTKVAARILGRLEIGSADRERFLDSILEEKNTLGIGKIAGSLRKMAGPSGTLASHAGPAADEETIDSAAFAFISDWYHYAILEMTNKRDFKLKPRWIAERLDISPVEAKMAIDRVLSLGLLKQGKNGRWYKRRLRFDTKDKTKTSLFHRQRIAQVLEKSKRSLANDPIEMRNHVATTVCVDPARIPEAKERVQKFIWELTEFLGGSDPRHVYEVAIQFFPLEKLPHEKRTA
jgi:uncharacterized protein (TIGR02147 family)